jgi:DNA-binding transcriptional LysR family regulator
MIPIGEPIETAELQAFTCIVETKSLSRAAIELGVPRATIGRRLARLEERLGTRLLRRTTRSLAVTDSGDSFYRQARIALDAVAQAQASVRIRDNAVRGNLRVSIPPLLDERLLGMLVSFADTYPDVRLQVDFSSRMVDLRRDGFDVALRASAELEPGLVVRTLARTKVLAVASPKYLAKRGIPRTAKDLRDHRCLMSFARGELPQSSWPLGRGAVHVEGAFACNDARLLLMAAKRGLGIALLPSLIIGDEIERGRLVQVLPGLVEVEHQIALVYPEREFLPPQVRAFVDAVVAWADRLPELQRPGRRRRAAEEGAPARRKRARA